MRRGTTKKDLCSSRRIILWYSASRIEFCKSYLREICILVERLVEGFAKLGLVRLTAEMVKIFVFGATGFIGCKLSVRSNSTSVCSEFCKSTVAVARALRTQGHRVYGLVRSTSKASELVKEEIIPILGKAENTDLWTGALEKLHIDVIVDCSGVMQGAMDILKACAAVSKKRIDTLGERGEKVTKLGFVYVSGLWVHGDSKEYGNDLLPMGANAPIKPAELVAWRVDVENELLRQSKVLNGVILRAGLLFGGSGSFIGGVWWSAIYGAIGKNEKSVELAGKEDTVLGLVHKDDFGQAVVKTVKKVCLMCLCREFDTWFDQLLT